MENIYIKALEKGYNIGTEGISLNEMREYLKPDIDKYNQYDFKTWFYLNFENEKRRINKINPNYGFNIDPEEKLRLAPEAVMQYLDYLELKEARESSNKAIKIAIIAIFISILGLFSDVFFSVKNFRLNKKIMKETISSKQKQETLIKDQPDTLNYKNAEQHGQFITIEVDSTILDTVAIRIID